MEQRNAISSLGEDTSIIIKEADKGGDIVLMNTDFLKRNKTLKCLSMIHNIPKFKIIIDKNNISQNSKS